MSLLTFNTPTATDNVPTPVSAANPLPVVAGGSAGASSTSALTVQGNAYSSSVTITRPLNTTAYTAGDVIGVDGGVQQVETATVVGTITSPQAQVETATAVGTITAAVSQVETATVVGTITLGGDATVVVTGAPLAGSPLTVPVAVAGTKQVETATVVGTVGPAGAGDVAVVVTAAGMTGSPKTINVAVANDDTAALVAGKIRTALIADADVAHATTGFFVCTGAGAEIILTAKAVAANDATMNISTADGTSSGVGSSPTSANTTAGVAGDSASAVAGKIRTALGLVAAITSVYTVGGASDAVTLTKTAPVANDATLNISIDNGTCTGLTTAATSANTTAGVAAGTGNATVVVTGAGISGSPVTVPVAVVAGDNANTWAGKVRDALTANAAITALYTVSGATNAIILTRTAAAANDGTLNISLDNGTCTGITTAATSANTTAGIASGTGNATVIVTAAGVTGSPLTVPVAVVAADNAAAVRAKIVTALQAQSALTAVYTVSGSGDDVVLTRITPAANDATLNISIDNGTCTGLTPDLSSTDTTAGSLTGANAGSAILSFTNAGPAGGHVWVTAADLMIALTAVPSGMTSFRLHLYDTSPTAILDNAAWDLPSGDRAYYQGYVDIGSPVDVGSTLQVQTDQINHPVKLAASSTTLYGILQTIGAYTPASGTSYYPRIRTAAA